MKKIISIITTISICVSFLFCGSIIAQGTGSGTELQVRPLITFEEDTATLVSNGMLKSDGGFTGLQSSNNASISSTSCFSSPKSAKIVFSAGESYSEIQVDNLADTNKPLTDWSGAQYLQFWTKNTSTTPIVIDTITIKQYGINSHYKLSSVYKTLAKSSTTWTDMTAIAEKDNSPTSSHDFDYGAIVIPSSFEGFIRVSLADFAYGKNPVNAYDTTIPMTGFSFWYYMAAGNNVVVYMDDISVVGEALANDVDSLAKTTTESVYFTSGAPVDNGDGGDTALKVRKLLSFEEDTTTMVGNGTINTDGTYKGLHSNDVIGISNLKSYTGGSSLKVKLASGEAYSEIQTDGLLATNKPLTDWSGAKYLQFWIKNSSSTPVTLDSINLYQEGVKNRYKFGSKFEALAKDSTTWVQGTTIPEKDYGKPWQQVPLGAITIPSSFEGFIRVKLTDFANELNGTPFDPAVTMTGFSFWFYMNPASNQTVYMDDVTILGETLATDAASLERTVEEADYFIPFYEPTNNTNVEKVKVLTSFEGSDTEIQPIWGINYVPYDFSFSSKFKYSGEQSYCAKVGIDEPGARPYSQFEINFPTGSELANWGNAQYMMLWIKNQSLSSVKIGSIVLTNSQNNTLRIDAGSNAVSLFKNGAWVDQTITTDDDMSMDVLEIPASYEGFMRVKLDGNLSFDVNEAEMSIVKFAIICTDPKSAIYFDDLSVVGTGISDVTETAQIPAEYFGSYMGGIVNDYNSSDFLNSRGTGSSSSSDDNGTVPDTSDRNHNIYFLIIAMCSLVVLRVSYRRLKFRNKI